MDAELTIQQVAALTQLSTYTLRYYEQIGLLDRISRAPSGHRRYSKQDIAWINFLTKLRATGMSIVKMQQFAKLRRQGDSTIPERRFLLEVHQQEVQEQLNRLNQNLALIQDKIKLYKKMELDYDDTGSSEESGKEPL
ncbi:MerR family transcriptional regulator [Mastigocoleus testarum]|uniref:MerR family transcriptional regulator n=1 Tax=Mastigocoleus testarum BC008 TaxID=371196 RepID=A0A0V7ZFK9_9CYAN|nr:MerR family transcriptional regulator [Mastigocoleus testarum]KST63148.1 MerR family transcriptional regulator [Mastigocoleus testarum BC008]KST63208.1 MerR family transcriptional regulator [Mastigocoleus testarum BC008]